jgi:hypothetical protein
VKTPEEIVREIRDDIDCVDFNDPITPDDLRRWADALEQAMREPIGVVEDVIIGASGAFGDHEIRKSRRARWLKNKPPVGTKLFAFPPDASGQPTATEYLLTFDVEALTEERNELEAEIERLRESVAWHERRWAELQKQQAQMRDPERKMVCDILANGKTYERAAFAKEDKP